MSHHSNTQQPSTPLFDNPLWDIKKTAEQLNVSEATLRDWIFKEQIPCVRINRLVRFIPSEIYRWIRERNQYGDREN